MRRMQLGLVLVTATLLTAAPAVAAPLQFSAVMKPQISGDVNTPRVGETLTEISAVWTRAPKSVDYHWLDCTAGQSIDQCAAIPGATGRSYTLQASDAGLYVLVDETGHDASGQTAVAVTPPTFQVQPADGRPIPPAPEPPPVPLSYPTLSGTAYLGDTVTATPGTWSPGTYTISYQWLSCGLDRCDFIEGASGLTHTVAPADLNYLIVLRAAATAAGGTSYAMTPFRLVARALPATKALLKQATLPHRLYTPYLLRHGEHPAFLAPAAGTVTITWTAGRVTLGRGTARCDGSHVPHAVPFRFTRRGKALMRRTKSRTITITGVFSPADGSPTTTYRRTWRLLAPSD
jgi:hypothetical protein